jgi:hypothetical protein
MRLVAASLLALAAPLAPVSAQAIIAQPSGLEFPARMLDFGAGLFPDGTALSTQFAGLMISHASYFTTASPVNNVAGGHLANDVAAGPPATLRIRFAQSVSDISFVYHQIGSPGSSTVRAMFQGFPVDSFTVQWNATQPNNFFGFLETGLDELQIDFVGDFRLDSLAFNPVGGAGCHPWNGTNVNPASFSCLTLPVLGETWQGMIWDTPNTLMTAMVYAPAGLAAPQPLLGGEFLLDASQPLVAFPGTTIYTLPIPAAASWVGTTLAFQGVRLELVGGSPTFVPLNALLLMLGL